MSLYGGEFRWVSPPQYNILRRKPVMRLRRNPSKRSLLLNAMPVSTDPDLSPSMGSARSSTSHCSSWSLSSELEHPLSPVPVRPGVKIDQLIKVNEAIAIELTHLESGKEKWLEKLKLLEARICSNIVNIDKWATENKSKPANIQAVDVGIVGNNKVEEGSVSESPLAWRLSLADLASIFKSSTFEHNNRSPFQHQRHGTAPSHGVDLYFDDHEGTPTSFKKGSYNGNEANELSCNNGAVDGVASSLKESDETPDNNDNRLALHGRNLLLTDSELISEALPDSKAVETRVGDSRGMEPVVSSEDQIPSLPEEKNHLQVDDFKLYDALFQAKKQLQQLEKYNATLEEEKANMQSTLRACQHALEETKLDVDNLRSQKEELQGMLTDSKTSFEASRLTLVKEKEEKEHKLLCSMQSLEDLQHSVMVLERQKLVLESELNHFRQAFEKEKQEVLKLNKEKAAVELDFSGSKRMLKESHEHVTLLQKEKETLGRELSETKENMEKYQQQCLVLEKAKDELQDKLTESKHGFEQMVEKYSTKEQERSKFEAAHKELMAILERSEQHALMLENENNALEVLLGELKHTLEGTQQQVIVLEEEKDYLKSELRESKQAFEEERQHLLSLEEEKVALEIGSCEYKQLIQETEQHVLTLQSALEGTLQRADGLDHQVQRLRVETKRLSENNENLQALKHEQETKCRDLEAKKEALQAELKSIKSKQEAAEEASSKVNALYASAIEGTEKEKAYTQALQHQQSLLEKENGSLKVSLEITMKKLKLLEAEQERVHIKLKDTECNLYKTMQELDALSADHANELAALRIENAANECQVQELMGQLQQKTADIERHCQVEANLHELCEKLNGQLSQLRSATSELESVKLQLAGKQVDLETERSTKASIVQELDANAIKLNDLEKELGRVRAEQAGLRAAMKDEMAKKKELRQKLQTEQAHSKELAAALEFSELRQNDILVHFEDEKMAKEGALEELEAVKGHCEELEKDLQKLQEEVQGCARENEDNESVLQVLLEERSRCTELEEALDLKCAEQRDSNMAWEGERHANEVMLKELEQQQRQRVQLEEELKVSKAREEHTVVALQDERVALENLKKCIDTQEARCKELETALNLARMEQQRRELEMTSLDDRGNFCSKQDLSEATADGKNVLADSEIENLKLEVSEIIAKSMKVEQALNTLEKGSAGSTKDAMRSAVTQEVRELQSRVAGIELRLADVGHMLPSDEVKGKEKEKKQNEDELLALLDESSIFGPKAPGLEGQIALDCNTSTDVARQAEEEIRRLKESTETFHQALFDAHHTAIADVAGLLVELKSLKRLLNDKSVAAGDKKEEKKRASLAIPTAALSTSALAALGLLALLKFPKSKIT